MIFSKFEIFLIKNLLLALSIFSTFLFWGCYSEVGLPEVEYKAPIKIYIKEGKKIELPNRFFRNNLSVSDLVEMAKDFTDYAHDDTRDTNYQTSLINGFELDVSNGCVESCEIY